MGPSSLRLKQMNSELLRMENVNGQRGFNISMSGDYSTPLMSSPKVSSKYSNKLSSRRFSMPEIETVAERAGMTPLSKPSPLVKKNDPSIFERRAGSMIKYTDDASPLGGKRRNIQSILQP